jgi:hypothetical protein
MLNRECRTLWEFCKALLTESFALFRRRVPCLRSAGFFDEIEERGEND